MGGWGAVGREERERWEGGEDDEKGAGGGKRGGCAEKPGRVADRCWG